jgi:hypothetical protein
MLALFNQLSSGPQVLILIVAGILIFFLGTLVGEVLFTLLHR